MGHPVIGETEHPDGAIPLSISSSLNVASEPLDNLLYCCDAARAWSMSAMMSSMLSMPTDRRM